MLDSEDAAIKELERQYARALKDIEARIKMFDYDIKQLQEAINADGLDDAAKAVLKSQQQAKIYQKQYQQALKGQISGVLDNLHAQQYKTIEEYLKACYTAGYIGTMYDIAKQGVPLIIPMDQAAVVKAVLTDSKIVEGYYQHLGVDYTNLKKRITTEISRGIASGLSYAEMSRNLHNISGSGLYNAKRIVRTEGHRIQQTSADDARRGAIAKGADVVKQWDAALDSRTRDSHARVDGEIREEDEKFSNGLLYPGDPAGKAEEVINCRCVATTRARWALDESELETLKERAEYFGLTKDKAKTFEEYQEKYLPAVAKMAAVEGAENDWTQTLPRIVTDAEKKQIEKYAKERGIAIGDIDGFDGDSALLMAELDTIQKTCKEYGVKSSIIVNVGIIDDADFAKTDLDKCIVTFNTKALRSRTITEQNIVNGKFFASKTLEDIALHEIGHIYAKEKGINGLDISKKVYYNMTGKYVSGKLLNKFLAKEISPNAANKQVEIAAEVIVCNKYKPNDEFVRKFMALLKGETIQ